MKQINLANTPNNNSNNNKEEEPTKDADCMSQHSVSIKGTI